jgi:hypothetical protein
MRAAGVHACLYSGVPNFMIMQIQLLNLCLAHAQHQVLTPVGSGCATMAVARNESMATAASEAPWWLHSLLHAAYAWHVFERDLDSSLAYCDMYLKGT